MSQNWFPGQQPQPTGPYQQQWGAAPGYGQPQQAQGWGGGGGRGGGGQWGTGQVPGQFQQPHFPGQHGMQPGVVPQQHQQFHSQHPMPGPQGIQHGTGTGFPQQQLMQQQRLQAIHQQEQQRQQALIQEQRRQQALIQEQQRKAREEQRKREFEIQKRKLAKVGVSKTSKPAANPLDELFGKKQTPAPTPSTSSAPLNAAPSHERPAETLPLPDAQLPRPPPEQTTPIAAEGEGQETKEAAKQNAAVTYQKLMVESLSNLDLQTSGAKGRAEFKVPVPVATPIPHPTSAAQPLQHTRARAWTAGPEEFSGMFAQHSPQQVQPMDSYGMFQSGPTSTAAGRTFTPDPAALQLQLQNQPPNLPLQMGGASQPNSQATLPNPASQPLVIGPEGGWGRARVAGSPDVPTILSTTTPTTAYSHPILATSIASGMTSSIQDQPFGIGGGVNADRMRSTSTPLQPHPPLQSRDPGNSSPRANRRDISNTASSISAGKSAQGGGATGSSGFTNLSISRFPPVYQEVYQKCAVSGSGFVSTELLFPILTSSGLSRSVLKELWSTANRAVPGKLSETELCVLLGLVGLKQSGHPSPSVEDLRKVTQPPIPKLSTISDVPSSLPQHLQAEVQRQTDDDFGDFQEASRAVTSQPPPLPTPTGKILQPVQPIKPELPPPLLPQDSSTGILQPSAPNSTQPPTSTPSSGAPSSLKPETSMSSQVTHNLGGLGKKPEPRDDKESTFSLPKVKPASKAAGASALDFDAFAGFSSIVRQPPASKSKEKILQPQAKKTEDLFPPLKSGENQEKVREENWADFSQFGNGGSSTVTTTTSLSIDTSQSQTPPTAVSESSSKQPPETQAVTSVAQPISPLGLEILEEQFLSNIMQRESKAPPTDGGLKASSDHPHVPQGDEDFGEFEAYSSPTAKQPSSETPQGQEKKGLPTNWTLLSKSQGTDAAKVWITCLSKCEELLGASARVFASVQEAGILEEIVQAEEGRNKLRGIAELFRLSKRIHCSLRSSNTTTTAKHLAEGIFQHWRTLVETLPNDIMEQLYIETAPRPVEKEERESVDVLSDSISKCSLCLEAKRVAIPQSLALDGRGEEYALRLLFHRGQSYHASCANFWCNAVQEELPTL